MPVFEMVVGFFLAAGKFFCNLVDQVVEETSKEKRDRGRGKKRRKNKWDEVIVIKKRRRPPG